MHAAHSPRYSSADNSTIDLMVDFAHIPDEVYSPYTCSAADDPYGLHARALAGDFGPIAPYVAPPLPVPASITRRQCARQLLVSQFITPAEALAMTQTSTPPAMVTSLLAPVPEPDRTLALIDFAADTYVRANPLLVGMMTAVITSQTPGATESQIAAAIDDFFRAAAEL